MPFQDLDGIPDDLTTDISRSKRQLPSGDWTITGKGRKVAIDKNAEVNIPDNMSKSLFEDANFFYKRGGKEAQLYLAAKNEISQNEQQLKVFNDSLTFGSTENSFSSTDSGVGNEICISDISGGECNSGDRAYTGMKIDLWSPLDPVQLQSTMLSFSAVREYNDYVAETNEMLGNDGSKRIAFIKTWRGMKTSVRSGGKNYRLTFGTWAGAIWDEIMAKARKRGQ